MPAAIAALLLQLGCAPAEFSGPAGPFLVWVCPPVVDAAPAAPEAERPEERGA
jgi:hypothetical protein